MKQIRAAAVRECLMTFRIGYSVVSGFAQDESCHAATMLSPSPSSVR